MIHASKQHAISQLTTAILTDNKKADIVHRDESGKVTQTEFTGLPTAQRGRTYKQRQSHAEQLATNLINEVFPHLTQ